MMGFGELYDQVLQILSASGDMNSVLSIFPPCCTAVGLIQACLNFIITACFKPTHRLCVTQACHKTLQSRRAGRVQTPLGSSSTLPSQHGFNFFLGYAPVSVMKPRRGVMRPQMIGTRPQTVSRFATRNSDSTAYPRVPMMIKGMLSNTTAALVTHETQEHSTSNQPEDVHVQLECVLERTTIMVRQLQSVVGPTLVAVNTLLAELVWEQ